VAVKHKAIAKAGQSEPKRLSGKLSLRPLDVKTAMAALLATPPPKKESGVRKKTSGRPGDG
jgi:hypothetical protein